MYSSFHTWYTWAGQYWLWKSKLNFDHWLHFSDIFNLYSVHDGIGTWRQWPLLVCTKGAGDWYESIKITENLLSHTNQFVRNLIGILRGQAWGCGSGLSPRLREVTCPIKTLLLYCVICYMSQIKSLCRYGRFGHIPMQVAKMILFAYWFHLLNYIQIAKISLMIPENHETILF